MNTHPIGCPRRGGQGRSTRRRALLRHSNPVRRSPPLRHGRRDLKINPNDTTVVAAFSAHGERLQRAGHNEAVIGFALIQEVEGINRSTLKLLPVTSSGLVDDADAVII